MGLDFNYHMFRLCLRVYYLLLYKHGQSCWAKKILRLWTPRGNPWIHYYVSLWGFYVKAFETKNIEETYCWYVYCKWIRQITFADCQIFKLNWIITNLYLLQWSYSHRILESWKWINLNLWYLDRKMPLGLDSCCLWWNQTLYSSPCLSKNVFTCCLACLQILK